jgi:tetrahydromethanopterin S-methyltransferase subunit G
MPLDDDFGDEEFEDLETTIQGLEERVEALETELERKVEQAPGNAISVGYVMGVALAMILSWSKNASILWCIFHGLLSWIYVIYFAIKR